MNIFDHSVSIHDALKSGIQVYASKGTHEARNSIDDYNSEVMEEKKLYKSGPFKFLGFKVQHDAKEPFGFVINHPEMGNCLFLTDSFYSKAKYANLNQLIVEANFDEDLIDEKMSDGKVLPFLRNRILESHMSIQTCLKMLEANDLSKVNNIVLCHLSDGNSHARQFQKKVEDQTGKTVTIAENGITINLNKRPF